MSISPRLILITFIVTWLSALSPVAAQNGPIGTVKNPIPIGTIVGFTELGDAQYTLQIDTVLRGADALSEMSTYGLISPKPAGSGLEHLLIHIVIHFEKAAAGKALILTADHFRLVSKNSKQASLTTLAVPKEELIYKELSPNDSFEGWMLFAVHSDEPYPVLTYNNILDSEPAVYFAAYQRKLAVKTAKIKLQSNYGISTPRASGGGMRCKDGTVSKSVGKRGACSHHGGVAK